MSSVGPIKEVHRHKRGSKRMKKKKGSDFRLRKKGGVGGGEGVVRDLR